MLRLEMIDFQKREAIFAAYKNVAANLLNGHTSDSGLLNFKEATQIKGRMRRRYRQSHTNVCVCVWLCGCERERERKGERDLARNSVCVWVCASGCVCKREKERQRDLEIMRE